MCADGNNLVCAVILYRGRGFAEGASSIDHLTLSAEKAGTRTEKRGGGGAHYVVNENGDLVFDLADKDLQGVRLLRSASYMDLTIFDTTLASCLSCINFSATTSCSLASLTLPYGSSQNHC